MLMTLFRTYNRLLLMFALPFFLWHGNSRGQSAQWGLEMIQMQRLYCMYVLIPMCFTGKSYSLLLPSEWDFSLFSNPIHLEHLNPGAFTPC